ncbi:hypothetical protein PB1_10404 [Bacillus methanolicus PB1]|uniref:Uncharacterized protein n=1 Tax=Bacillus methanolicus PB1 TaxID=997296 RepID=I3DUQ4_BACMT|nr:hypothetical protein PB1_10404 [Bacillus methanolicus PB1]
MSQAGRMHLRVPLIVAMSIVYNVEIAQKSQQKNE